MSERNTIPAEAQKASALLRAVEALVRLGGALATLMILAIFGLVCVAVANRYILGAPIQWADELIGYLLVATIMLGAAEALSHAATTGEITATEAQDELFATIVAMVERSGSSAGLC